MQDSPDWYRRLQAECSTAQAILPFNGIDWDLGRPSGTSLNLNSDTSIISGHLLTIRTRIL